MEMCKAGLENKMSDRWQKFMFSAFKQSQVYLYNETVQSALHNKTVITVYEMITKHYILSNAIIKYIDQYVNQFPSGF